MFGKKSVEILVAGAGPCGMATALALAQHGIDTAIVDSEARACTRSNAIQLNPQTLQLIDKLGFVERVIDSGYRINKLLIYDQTQPRETVDLGELPGPFPFAISIPQAELEFILEDELNKAGVHVLWNHRVAELARNDHGFHVDIDRYSERGMGYAISHTDRVVEKTLHYQAKLVIAADGYNSLLRRFTPCETSKLGEDQHFVFFEFETDMDPEHAVRVSIHDQLATAQYPMNGGFARLAFQHTGPSLPSENRNKDRDPVQDQHGQPEFLDDSHFRDLIERRVPWITGYINRISYRAAVPFEKRYVQKPYADGVFFIGDAARSFGPLASLSLNLGLEEADELTSRYKASRQNPKDLDHELSELGLAMASQWRAIADMERLSTPIEKADPWVANNRARILRTLPATGELLERLATQIFIHVKVREPVGA